MKVILIILLIIFLLITALLSITIISRNKSAASEEVYNPETTESGKNNKITVPDSKIETINDIQKFFIGDLLSDMNIINNGSTIEDNNNTPEPSGDNELSDTLIQQNEEETDGAQLQDNESDSTEEEAAEEEKEEEKIENGTIKFFLDGDMENGIYLGKTICNIESTEASQLYGEDFKNTGFEFIRENNEDINLLPVPLIIFIFIFMEQVRMGLYQKEIDLSGEEISEKNIIIFIDEPEEKTITSILQLIKGWAVDLRNSNNPGIKEIEIYLNGPRGYGKFLGSAQYGIHKAGCSRLFWESKLLKQWLSV